MYGLPYTPIPPPAEKSKPSLPGIVNKLAGAAVLGYHGYRRGRGSVAWTAGWAALGLVMPGVGIAVAALQGFGSRPEKED